MNQANSQLQQLHWVSLGAVGILLFMILIVALPVRGIEDIRQGALSTAEVINQTSTALEEQTAVSQDVASQVKMLPV
ncbi:hypothetical protein [Marinospirillum celere]|uniref:hypothetical protein n=1 Tax=Marinospirillum celere TaxID=1122252 RepID=UPI000B85DCD6|nr:hypothetical protein [Marinospirillum celere]